MTELPIGNALDYEPDEDAYYISLKGMGGLAKVDRSSGQTPWVLTGAANQLSFPDGPVEIALHHQFQVLDDSILIFDNGDEDIGDSRVVEIAIDTDASTQVVWSTSGEPGRGTRRGPALAAAGRAAAGIQCPEVC